MPLFFVRAWLSDHQVTRNKVSSNIIMCTCTATFFRFLRDWLLKDNRKTGCDNYKRKKKQVKYKPIY